MLSGETTADVENGRRLIEQTAIVPARVDARHEDRTDDGKTNLAAVKVTGQHQINFVSPGPNDIVRCMAQAKSKSTIRAARYIRCGTEPGTAVPDCHEA